MAGNPVLNAAFDPVTLCPSSPRFGLLFSARYSYVLWGEMVPPTGYSALSFYRLMSAVTESMRPSSTADSVAAAADKANDVPAKVVEACAAEAHLGPIAFAFRRLPMTVRGRSEPWPMLSDKTYWTERGSALWGSVVGLFCSVDLVYRETTVLDLTLDAFTATSKHIISAAPTLAYVARVVTHTAVDLLISRCTETAITYVAFVHGQRVLRQQLQQAAGKGLTPQALMDNTALMAALHAASHSPLLSYHCSRIQGVRLLRWMHRKVQRAPIALVPRFIRNPIGRVLRAILSPIASALDSAGATEFEEVPITVPSLAEELSTDGRSGVFGAGDAVLGLVSHGHASAAFLEECLNQSVVRTVFQRNVVGYATTIATTQIACITAYLAAFRYGGSRQLWVMLAKEHAMSNLMVAMQLGTSFGLRLTGAAVGHRLLPRHGLGAFWLEALLHYGLNRYTSRFVRAAGFATMRGLERLVPAPEDPSQQVVDTEFELARLRDAYFRRKAEEHHRKQQQQKAASATDGSDDASQQRQESRDMGEDDFASQDRQDLCTDADLYKVLGVETCATPEAIRKAYRKQALQYHPDRVQHLPPTQQAEATSKFKALSKAYDVLVDSNRRREYDAYVACRAATGGDDAASRSLFTMLPRRFRQSRAFTSIAKLASASFPFQVGVAAVGSWIGALLIVSILEGNLLAALRLASKPGNLPLYQETLHPHDEPSSQNHDDRQQHRRS